MKLWIISGAVAAAAVWGPAAAQAPAQSEGCALSASPNVLINGKAMLRLGDVQGCEGLRWEIIPGLMINGQPAVRLLPTEECGGPSGSENVLADGAPVSRQGDGCGG